MNRSWSWPVFFLVISTSLPAMFLGYRFVQLWRKVTLYEEVAEELAALRAESRDTDTRVTQIESTRFTPHDAKAITSRQDRLEHLMHIHVQYASPKLRYLPTATPSDVSWREGFGATPLDEVFHKDHDPDEILHMPTLLFLGPFAHGLPVVGDGEDGAQKTGEF